MATTAAAMSVYVSWSCILSAPFVKLVCVETASVCVGGARLVRGAALVFASAALCPLQACALGGLFLYGIV